MDPEVQKFFERFIGYDGETWSVDHAKKHGQDHAWFLHDMERMLDNRVGYPSLLHLMNTIAYLGYCLEFDQNWEIPKTQKERTDEMRRAGEKDHFNSFCDKYLGPINRAYPKLSDYLFQLARHRLSHIYFAHIAVTTYPSDRHLTIMDKGTDHPHFFISVHNFFKDTQKAIESLYKELGENVAESDSFLRKQKFLLDESWKLNQVLKNITLEVGHDGDPGFSGEPPESPPPAALSGIPYTPPQGLK